MFGSNSRIKLLLALVALVLFLGMFAVSALTIRTTQPPQNTAAPEIASERSRSAHKNFAVRKGGHGPRAIPHSGSSQAEPETSSTSTGSAGTGDAESDINMISVIGTIVSTLGTILSVWIAWLTYKQGKLTPKI